MAQEQREWKQAEEYYQQALQISIESQDRYGQASTYYQLGMMAQEQREWKQALAYFLQSLEIVVAYEDNYRISFVLGSLARLWQASGDKSTPDAVAAVLNMSRSEVEELFNEMLGNKPDESKG